jgi:hypothetical protein
MHFDFTFFHSSSSLTFSLSPLHAFTFSHLFRFGRNSLSFTARIDGYISGVWSVTGWIFQRDCFLGKCLMIICVCVLVIKNALENVTIKDIP